MMHLHIDSLDLLFHSQYRRCHSCCLAKYQETFTWALIMQCIKHGDTTINRLNELVERESNLNIICFMMSQLFLFDVQKWSHALDKMEITYTWGWCVHSFMNFSRNVFLKFEQSFFVKAQRELAQSFFF